MSKQTVLGTFPNFAKHAKKLSEMKPKKGGTSTPQKQTTLDSFVTCIQPKSVAVTDRWLVVDWWLIGVVVLSVHSIPTGHLSKDGEKKEPLYKRNTVLIQNECESMLYTAKIASVSCSKYL